MTKLIIKNIYIKIGLKKLGLNYGFKSTCSNLFAGLPLGAEVGSFSSMLSYATAIVGSVLQMQRLCQSGP